MFLLRVGRLWSAPQPQPPSLVTARSHSVTGPGTPPDNADMQRGRPLPLELATNLREVWSTCRHFQPGEGLSRGLLHDCKTSIFTKVCFWLYLPRFCGHRLGEVSPPLLLISPHVNGSSSVASPAHVLVPGCCCPTHSQPAPAPGCGASLHHQPSQPSPAQPSPGFTFYGRVEGWGALGTGRGAAGGHWLYKPFSKCVVWRQSASDSSLASAISVRISSTS